MSTNSKVTNNRPHISIIVPIYNSEKSLDRCIKSILAQTLINIELILVDDGSKDNSFNIAKSYENSDCRIKVISKKNGGVSTARNLGIKNARGEYIAFVDSDDYINKNMMEVMYDKAKSIDADMVCCDMLRHTHYGIIPYNIHSEIIIADEKIDIIKNVYPLAIKGFLSQVWNKIYKMDLIKTNYIKFNESRCHGEDFEFNLDALTYTQKFIYIPLKLYNYIELEISQTRRYIKNKIDLDLQNFNMRIKYLKNWNVNSKEYNNYILKIFLDDIYYCVINEITNSDKNIKDKFIEISNILKDNKCVNRILNNYYKTKIPIYLKFRIIIIRNLNIYLTTSLYYLKYEIRNIGKLVFKKYKYGGSKY